MVIFKNIIFVILSILMVLFVLYILNLVMTLTSLFDAKKQDITIKSNRLSSSNLLDKCEATASLLKIIDIIIDLEISQLIRTYTSLNTKYNINKIPDDVSNISKNVYTSIKKEVYLNDDSIITEDYLMSYITNIVTMNLINSVRSMNNVIYEEK